MIKNLSPLRYPGGKKKLTPFLISLLKLNNINNPTYIEPFAGGSGVALNLLLLEYAYNIVINDADYSIYCFWKSILNKNDQFMERIKNVKVSITTWRQYKEIITNPKKYNYFDIGFATFFLNRCNRSGILNAGPIGGIKQSGKWKIDARFNKVELINRIERLSQYINRIKIYNLDAIDLLKKYFMNITGNNKKNYFLYLDPPYYFKGEKLYLNYYHHNNHVELSVFIQKEIKLNRYHKNAEQKIKELKELKELKEESERLDKVSDSENT